MKTIITFLLLFCHFINAQTIPYQYGWPRSASSDWGLYSNSPTIDDINKDGNLNVSVTKSFATPELYVWRANGAFLPGFPVSIPPGNLQNSGSIEISAVGDVTGDGFLEIVFGDENGQLFVLNKDGAFVGGGPFNFGPTKKTTTPALADVDKDTTLEIIITSYERDSPYNFAQLNVLKWNGTNFVQMPGFPIPFAYGGDSAPVVGDVDGDDEMEIVYITGGRIADSTFSRLNVIKLSGESLRGYPKDLSLSTVGSTPALYDLNKNGKLEIIIRMLPYFTGINGIYAYDWEGNLYPNFPFPVRSGHPFANVAIADMNGDGEVEIAFGSVLAVDSGQVWAWHLDGTLLPNYPQLVNATWVDGAVCMADVDGDGLPDVIAPTNKGFIYAFNLRGELCSGFPLQAENVYVVTGFESSPTVADIDGDGDTEIFAGSLNRRVYGWDTPGIWDSDNVWLTYKGNAQRTGGQLYGYRPTSIKENLSPEQFYLYQNYPNPFNPSTIIKFSIPAFVETSSQNRSDHGTSLRVYDILGKEIATLINKEMQPGIYEIKFDGSSLPSGIYFYRLTSGGYSETKKMIYLR